MSVLRVKGDMAALEARRDTSKKGLTKRIREASEPTKRCPRCKRDLAYHHFFYRSFDNIRAGLPTATQSSVCGRCRTRKHS